MAGPGYHMINVTTTDTTGNTANCIFAVTVIARTCPTLTAPSNGRVNCSYRYSEGSECTVTCDRGYELVGQSPVTCQQSRQWDQPVPACEFISCPTPAPPSYGSLQCPSGYVYAAVCWLQCPPGFQTPSVDNSTCQEDKTWTALGICVDTQAPQFRNGCPDNVEAYTARIGQPNLVSWKPPEVTDNSGLKVDPVSDVIAANYSFPVGVTIVTYTATDMAGNSNNCSFPVTVLASVCPLPDFSQHMAYNCPDGYLYGASCNLSCTDGYPLVGFKTMVCERDDSVYPPDIFWEWNGPRSVPPKCTNSTCPTLTPPKNGALACLLGNFGYDCMLSCQSGYDITTGQTNDGHYYCPFTTPWWIPSGTVPDCKRVRGSTTVRLQSDLFYYTGDCNTATDVIKENFITRMTTNSVLSSACVSVPSCVVENVKVTCGVLSSGRKKRSQDSVETSHHHHLHKRESSSHYYQVFYDVVVTLYGSEAMQDTTQTLTSLQDTLSNDLTSFIANGTFDLPGMTVDPNPGLFVLTAVCPAGTKSSRLASSSFLSCVGCGAGLFMNTSDACTECPVGAYVEVDNATSCVPCPEGWSTVGTGSRSSNDCRKLCPHGHVSPDGFAPCSPCPPGHYNTQTGARSCSVCLPNTWTDRDGANSSDQCSQADLVLSNTSVTVQFQLPTVDWVVVSLWVSIPVNGSLQLRVGDYANISITTCDVTEGHCANESGIATGTRNIPPYDWSRVDILLVPSGFQASGAAPVPPDFLVISLPTVLGAWNGTKTTNLVLKTESKKVYVSEVKFPIQYDDPDSPTQQHSVTWPPSVTRIVSTPSLFNASAHCDCGDHGQCQYQGRITTCLCQDGWSGYTCQVPPDTCYRHLCQNRATCLSDVPAAGRNYTCQCAAGFTGINCTDQIVDGGWTEWSAWGNCSAMCRGQQQRQRWCTNPSPLNSGSNCTGDDADTQDCGLSFCRVDGAWEVWTSWSDCSAPCRAGEMNRTRLCLATPGTSVQEGDEIICRGDHFESMACNTDVPCPIAGGWSNWNEWAACSVTCDSGSQSRNRSCDNPVPTNGGNNCSGFDAETRICKERTCPSCTHSPSQRPTGGQWNCSETQFPYLRTCTLVCLGLYVTVEEVPPFLCGEESGYLWNHESTSKKVSRQLPSCTKSKPITVANYSQKTTMNTGCEDSSAVVDAVKQNLSSSIPCVQNSSCSQEVTSECPTTSVSGRVKKNAPQMVLHLTFTIDLSRYQNIGENDADTWTEYNNQMSNIYESITMVNDTEKLLTVVVGDRVITPDMTSFNASMDIQCPEGSVLVYSICADCPAGTMASDGQCQLCPIGQYQDQSAATRCLDCPNGFTTEMEGASSMSLCFVPVNAGSTPSLPPLRVGDSGPPLTIILPVVFSVVAFVVVVVIAYIVWKKNQLARNSGHGHRTLSRSSLGRVSPYPLTPLYFEGLSLPSVDKAEGLYDQLEIENFPEPDPETMSYFEYKDPIERPSSQ